ncbi:MAG: Uma2 family endonuclease [Chloroflexota bacterium]|nr:Uma2 family endonuclease [Chloroflexota bacterium]
MTSKLTTQANRPERLSEFPAFPPRDDMQNAIYLYDEGHQPALRLHFGNRPNVLVLAEVPIYWYPSRYPRIPDLTVAFDINRPGVIDRNGYSIEEHGKPPDFVLEVASPTTARNDYTDKREDYAAFGIPEYWRFDPTGGRRYDTALAGDRLADGVYRRVEISGSVESALWGRSDVLGLDICWEGGRLRWWNPETRVYLETHDELAGARLAEQEARLVEHEAYLAEREARLAAEARIRELEAELGRQTDP